LSLSDLVLSGSKPRFALAAIARLAFLLLLASLVFVPSMSPTSSSPFPVSSHNHPLASGLPSTTAPGLTLSASPASLDLTVGSKQTSQITVTSVGGFSGKVYLSTFSFHLQASLSADVIQLSQGETATALVTVTAPSNTPPGPDDVFFEGDGGCTLSGFTRISVSVTGPDFAISSDKTQMTISPGSSDTGTITVTSQNGLAGTVSLSTPYLLGTSLIPLSLTLSRGGTGISILTVSVPQGTRPGDYQVSVNGQYGTQLFHSVEILVTVPGPTFTLSAAPEPLTLIAGGESNSSTITATAAGGFTGTIELDNSSMPAGLTITLASKTLTIPGATASTLSVAAPLGTKASDFFIEVSGTSMTPSGAISSTTRFVVIVKASDFQITADPRHVNVVGGASSSCTSTITATGLQGFSETISLALTSYPVGLSLALDPPSVSFPDSPTSTLTMSAPAGTSPGRYVVVINGTSSSGISHETDVFVQVIGPDFSLSSYPDTVTLQAGQTDSTTISVTSQFEFTGDVTLAANSFDPDVSVSLSSTSILGGSGTSQLSVTIAGTAPPGYSLVNVTGTSGNLVHMIFASVYILGPGFSLSSNPATITVAQGASGTSAISVTPLNGFTDTVDLFAFSFSSDLNASIDPGTITAPGSATLSVNSTIPGSYTVDVSGVDSSNSIINDTFVTVTITGPDYSLSATPSALTITAGSSSTSTISVNPVSGFSSAVDLSAGADTGLTVSFNPSTITPDETSILTIEVATTVSPGSYTVDVQGASGSFAHDVSVVVNVAGFTVAAYPANAPADGFTSATSTIVVNPLNGFSDTVVLSDSSLPSELDCQPFNPSTITGSGTSSLSCTSTTAGSYPVTITGTNGSLTETATATFTFTMPPDFSLDATPSASFASGSTGTSTITISSQNGFDNYVTLSAQVSPTSGLTVSFNPATLYPGQSTATFSSTTAGSYTVSIKGTSGSTEHTTIVDVTVMGTPDVSLTTSTTSLSFNSGTSATDTITISPQNGFTDTVTLAVTSPTGVSCSLDPTSIQSSGTSTLTCNSSTAGDYLVTITATGGATLHETTVNVHVAAVSPTAPAPSTILGLDPAVFYGIIGVAILVVVVGTALALRARRSGP